MHCLLGDVRADISLYEKAWELSGKRFARAKRALASYYFGAKEYDKCIEAYDLALAINPLFDNSWFIMGCAALQIEDLNTADRAFTRVVQIDPSVNPYF
jgi:tetratricopeptide (TPR) repeat protein